MSKDTIETPPWFKPKNKVWLGIGNRSEIIGVIKRE